MRMPTSVERVGRLLSIVAWLCSCAVMVVVVSPARVGVAHASDTGLIRTTTSTGRQGAYLLPRGREQAALPLLVMLHGTGGKGSTMILRLRPVAERDRFIAVAPDSVSVAGAWLAGQSSGGPSEDYRHVLATVREVLALPNVRVDAARVLIAGFSVGSGLAADIASREQMFTSFAVLHGHVALDAIGPRRVRGWLSTGDRDRTRPPDVMKGLAERMRRDAGFSDVSLQVFRVDHTLSDEELDALVTWWLGRPR